MTSQIFAQPSEVGPAAKRFGHPGSNGRYHMPLLPGESGPKDGGDWVPGGVQRMTNLVGAFEDTRALSVWEQGMGLIGLARSPELYEELCLLVDQAESEGVIFELLRDYPDLKEALAGHPHDRDKQDRSIIGRAKLVARAQAAAARGTHRHTAWEHRAKTGNLIGTAAIQESTLRTEALLAEAGLARAPGLSERVVRNVQINVVGKFDDVLLELATGRFLMGDLKTKSTPFYSWMTVDAQLAGYARSEWMLTPDGTGYEPGPVHAVDLTEGVILHVPSDGGPARLERVDLEQGWRVCLTARVVIDLRAGGKSAARHSRSAWIGQKNLEIAS